MKKLICVLAIAGFAAFAQADELNLKIEGMVCEQGCVKAVDNALKKVTGVTEKKVEIGKAKVTFDPAKTKKEDIVAAIKKAGYDVVN